MLGLVNFVLGPMIVEAQYRDAPFIDHGGVEFTTVVILSNAFSTTGDTQPGTVEFSDVIS